MRARPVKLVLGMGMILSVVVLVSQLDLDKPQDTWSDQAQLKESVYDYLVEHMGKRRALHGKYQNICIS